MTERRGGDARSIVDELTYPQSADRFFATSWSADLFRASLHPQSALVRLRDRNVLAALVSDMASGSIRDRAELFQNGRALDEPRQTLDEVLRRGVSIRLAAAERSCAFIADYCADLSAALWATVSANIYWTPPRSRALSEHFDGHDVFVVQLLGSKRWSLKHERVAAPLEDGPLVPRLETAQQASAEIATAFRVEEKPASAPETVLLQPGSVLYVPRGTFHSAQSAEDESVHLTFAVYTTSLLDCMALVTRELAKTDARWRAHIPRRRGGDVDPLPALLADLCSAVQADDWRSACGEMRRRLADRLCSVNGRPVAAEPHRADGFDVTREIRRRPGTATFAYETRDGFAAIRFADKELTAPAAALRALEFVAAHTTFSLAELPGLPGALAEPLVRRLHGEGLLANDWQVDVLPC